MFYQKIFSAFYALVFSEILVIILSFSISFLIPSASANIDASLDCNRYTAEESKALCKSYEKERRELLEEISELHQKLKNTKAIWELNIIKRPTTVGLLLSKKNSCSLEKMYIISKYLKNYKKLCAEYYF